MILLRYDISSGQATAIYGPILGMKMEAIWHTAILVFGTEYLFDGGGGIMRFPPRTTPFGQPLREESLGKTKKTKDEFEEFNAELTRTRFGPNHYEILTNNCNHYTNEAAFFLTGKGCPDDVINMIPNMMTSPLGSFISPIATPIAETVIRGAQSGAMPEVPTPGVNLPKELPKKDERARPGPEGNFGPQATRGDPLGPLKGLFSNFMGMSFPGMSNPFAGGGGAEGGRQSGNAEPGWQPQITEVSDDDGGARQPRSPPRATTNVVPDAHSYTRRVNEDDVEEVVIKPTKTSPAGSDAHHFSGSASTTKRQNSSNHFDPNGDAEDVVLSPGSLNPNQVKVASAVSAFDESLAQERARHDSNLHPLVQALGALADIARVQAQGRTPETPIPLRTHILGRVSSGASWLQLLGYHLDTKSQVASIHTAYGASKAVVQALYEAIANALEELETELVIRESVIEAAKSDAAAKVQQETASSREASSSSSPLGASETSPKPVASSSAKLFEPSYNREWTQGPGSFSFGSDLRSQPITTFAELMGWDGSLDYRPDLVPLIPREVSNRRYRRKLAVIHDFKGGNYTDDAYWQHMNGASATACYVPQYLHRLDYFVYFSHQFLTIPPVQWVHLLHRHGVPCLGTLFTAQSTPEMGFWRTVLTCPPLRHQVTTKLARLATLIGFDGWMIDTQTSLSENEAECPTLMADYVAFIAELRGKVKEANPHGLVINYDTLNAQGVKAPQGGVIAPLANTVDAHFLHYACDGIAIPEGKADVFITIDAFGRAGLPGKSDIAASIRSSAAKDKSICIFAPGWTFEDGSTGPQSARIQFDAEWWAQILNALDDKEHIAGFPISSLPFTTQFNTGHYASPSASRIQGRSASIAAAGANLGDKPVFHLEQFDAAAPRAGLPGVELSTDNSFNGPSCLKVKATKAAGVPTRVPLAHFLFGDAPLTAISPTSGASHPTGSSYFVIQYTFRAQQADTKSVLIVTTVTGEEFALAPTTASTSLNGTKVTPCYQSSGTDGWTTQRFAVRTRNGDAPSGSAPTWVLSELSTLAWNLIGSPNAVAYLGQLSLSIIHVSPQPNGVSPLSILSTTSPLPKPFLGADPASTTQIESVDMLGAEGAIALLAITMNSVGGIPLAYSNISVDGRFYGRCYGSRFHLIATLPATSGNMTLSVTVQPVDIRGIAGSTLEHRLPLQL